MDDSTEIFAFLNGQQKQSQGLLHRVDRALVKAWRATWRCIIEGFAAYGAAECGLWLDPVVEPANHSKAEIQEIPNYAYNYSAVDEEKLRSDFADINELIRALQTAGE